VFMPRTRTLRKSRKNTALCQQKRAEKHGQMKVNSSSINLLVPLMNPSVPSMNPLVPLMNPSVPSTPLMIPSVPSTPSMIPSVLSTPSMIPSVPSTLSMILSVPSTPSIIPSVPVPPNPSKFIRSSADEIENLCIQIVKLPSTTNTIRLKKNRDSFSNFFHDKHMDESRGEYVKKVVEEIGFRQCLGVVPIRSDEFEIRYKDGSLFFAVFRNVVPTEITEHLTGSAKKMTQSLRQCGTRLAFSTHFGGHEYNPRKKQLDYYDDKQQVWKLENETTKDNVQEFLPELLLANDILKKVAPHIHKRCTTVPEIFRMAETAFTRSALNVTECKLHRDHDLGLDVIFYGGDWLGGGLRLPQLDLEVDLKPGDIVVMDGILFHSVTSFAGERISLVFFTKRHNIVSESA